MRGQLENILHEIQVAESLAVTNAKRLILRRIEEAVNEGLALCQAEEERLFGKPLVIVDAPPGVIPEEPEPAVEAPPSFMQRLWRKFQGS